LNKIDRETYQYSYIDLASNPDYESIYFTGSTSNGYKKQKQISNSKNSLPKYFCE